MGLFSTLTIDEIVASAKGKLQLRTTDSDIYMADSIHWAIRRINAGNVFSKELPVVLPIEDRKSRLPCNYYGLLGLRFGSGNTCQDLLYVDMEFLTNCGCQCPPDAISFAGTFEIDKGWIFYHNIPEGTEEVTLSYMGINQDAQGRNIVLEDFHDALVAYACYDFCLQNMDETKYANQMQQHYQIWKAQKRWLQSEAVYNKFRNQKHQIRSIMNAWISDKSNYKTI